MSDQSGSNRGRAGQGASASGYLPDEGLPESVVQLEAQFEKLKSELLEALRPPEQLELPLFGELLDEWLQAIRPKRVEPENEVRLSRHLRDLFLDDEASLSAGQIAQHLAALPGLSASSRNKVRSVGRLTIEHARANRRWQGNNPFALVRRVREESRTYVTLTDDELRAVQEKLRVDRRREFRVALHLGLRPGELFALRKSDVDFNAGTIFVHRSHGRDETKTGKDRLVPLLPSVAQDIYEAHHQSPSDILFAAPSGAMQRADTKLTRVIRTAMVEAAVGILECTYKCRHCGSRVKIPGGVRENVCTDCDRLRWPVPRVKAYRWYDLRHTCATAHRRAGADPLAVAVTLGHSVQRSTTTDRTYTHFTVADLHRELGKWSLAR